MAVLAMALWRVTIKLQREEQTLAQIIPPGSLHWSESAAESNSKENTMTSPREAANEST